MTEDAQQFFPTIIHLIESAAERVRVFDLRDPSGITLPRFAAGAHIDVKLPNGLVRSYSIVNSPTERHRYLIAIERIEASRGGSRFLHEQINSGDTLSIAGPKNNFRLIEVAPHTVLIAGGIGITPLWCMAKRLTELGRPWTLHYSVRNAASGAFVPEINAIAAQARARTNIVFSRERGGGSLDIGTAVAEAPPGSHLYCCGPASMLANFRSVTHGWPREAVHVESFRSNTHPRASGGFTVTLARSQRDFFIPPGQSILEVLLAAGIDVPFSCMHGVCGACETKVISGTPDHRDEVLSSDQRALSGTMMICCSGAVGGNIVLDL